MSKSQLKLLKSILYTIIYYMVVDSNSDINRISNLDKALQDVNKL